MDGKAGGWLLLAVVLAIGGGEAAPPADTRADPGLYNVGVGMHDVTGPAAGVNMMGYANPAQINKGIHLRLYSRAFIIDDGVNRVVFVSVDLGMMATSIKIGVVERLQELYDGVYNSSNVMLSGTHSHSGPAGFMQYLLYDITSLGFIQESFDAIVEGVVQSIVTAHDSIQPGRIYVSEGQLLNASINRSPYSYKHNPEDEKAKYEYDTDKTMTLLKFVAEDGTDLGMLNWFAVHGTSMNNTNLLVSGDNKGYAEQMFERAMNPGALPGEGKFVAAFAQTNCGDVSPNTKGPMCQDTGEPCDVPTSTCGGRVQPCIASGPGKDMVESTKIIGNLQYEKAMELYNDESATQLTGPVGIVSQFLNMSDYSVTLQNGSSVKTCKPALGYSFAAGTTDGPGAFDFTQGMTQDNPFWNTVVNFIRPTDPEQIACHHPKPVLLDTGNYNKPYPWHPHIVDTQLARVGQLMIAAVPGEFTTMAGRRLRDHIKDVMASNGVADTVPVIAGLSNVYSHYITTFEEYAVQRYEGASTLYGPYTHQAYVQQYGDLAEALANGEVVERGPPPADLLDEQLCLLPPVVFDGTVTNHTFGDVLAQPYPLAYSGETIVAKFVSGHPRNNVMQLLGSTFLTVEQLQPDNSTWKVIFTDADWETRFEWHRTSRLLGASVVTVSWDTDDDTEGIFRITHTGYHKRFLETPEKYTGVTDTFKVVQREPDMKMVGDERSDREIPASVSFGFLDLLNDIFSR